MTEQAATQVVAAQCGGSLNSEEILSYFTHAYPLRVTD